MGKTGVVIGCFDNSYQRNGDIVIRANRMTDGRTSGCTDKNVDVSAHKMKDT